jgi:hypothetical protein
VAALQKSQAACNSKSKQLQEQQALIIATAAQAAQGLHRSRLQPRLQLQRQQCLQQQLS